MTGGWKIVSTKQTATTIDIFLQLDVALLNSSTNKTISMALFGLALKKSLKTCYEISYYQAFYETPKQRVSHLDNFDYLNRKIIKTFKKVTIHLDVKWRILVKRMTMINEHLVEIKDDKVLPGVYARVNNIYGSEIYVNVNSVKNIISGYDRNTLAHELGHSLGLLHVDINTNFFSYFGFESDQYWSQGKQLKDTTNMMYSGGNKYMNDSLSTHITSEQMILIIKNIRSKSVNQ